MKIDVLSWEMFFVVIISLAGIGYLGYLARYDLGLVSPKFNVGDCLKVDLSNTFETHFTTVKITEVSNKQYKLFFYKENMSSGRSYTESIWFVDTQGEKIPCPEIRIIK